MVFLFGDQPFLEKITTILRLTRMHAVSLAKFTCCFRLLKELLMRLDGVEGDIPREWHSLIAAGIVGYFVFGENNQVNSQN
ncbi:hypothetical protein OESDEN_14306 [Oesophagostomum dentatum]|uniref:Uncharacterized protein n=1 Tax=Oesophagostomum dentatum TaxID=61180 RepID=A0A0B1SR10_OESDE|nr:hypothetical protein OESDEN_14306 [Oesophagostomum dentatum]